MRILIGYLLAAAVGALGMLLWLRQPVHREISNDFVITEIKRVAKAFAAEQVVAFTYKHKRMDIVSTAQVSIFGKARAFAGFDLMKHLRVNVDQTKRRVLVELAQPEILGVDVFEQTYQYEKDWPWNRFSEEDRDAVAHGLRQGVLNEATAGPLLREARESMKDFLAAMFRVYGYAIIVEFSGPETIPPTKGQGQPKG